MSDIQFNLQLRPPKEDRRKIVSYVPGADKAKPDGAAGGPGAIPPRLELDANRVQEYVCAPIFDRNCQPVENGVSWIGGQCKYLIKPNPGNPLVRGSGAQKLPVNIKVTDVVPGQEPGPGDGR